MNNSKSVLSAVFAALMLCGCGLTACVFTASVLTACGGVDYTEEDVMNALEELLPASAELNVIYFGEGLPIATQSSIVEEFYESFQMESDVKQLNYAPVDPDCGYTCEQDIRDATLAVFSEEYSEYLFARAFSGISSVMNEGTETQTTTTAVYALYLDRNGRLTERLDLADDAVYVPREYDTANAEIVRMTPVYANIIVPSRTESGAEASINVRLVKTESGWRLDSPTY